MLVSYAKMSQYLCTDLCICDSCLRHLVDFVPEDYFISLFYHYMFLFILLFIFQLYICYHNAAKTQAATHVDVLSDAAFSHPPELETQMYPALIASA